MSERKRDISWWVGLIGGIIGIVAAISAPFFYYEGRIDQVESMILERDKIHSPMSALSALSNEVDDLQGQAEANEIKIRVIDQLSEFNLFPD